MLTGLAGGALWALDTVILGMALALPVFTGDPKAAILAPFASTFLHDLCSSLWMLGYTGLRRQYKAVWQAIRTRGGRFVALGALLGGPVGMTGYVLAINAIGPAYTAIISALYPALGTVLAHFFLKEKLRPTGLIGLALSIGGVIALGYTPGAALPKGHLLGFGCALLCCIGWAAEGVICTYGLQSSTVTNAQALQIRQPVSALTYAIVLLPACKGWGFTAGLFGTRALWIIALSALCGTASYLCYYKALGKLLALRIVQMVRANMKKNKGGSTGGMADMAKGMKINKSLIDMGKGFTVKRVCMMAGGLFTKEQILEINAKLNKIKKKQK